MADNTLVLIASNLRPMDAEMMRLHLESLGIESFIQNQMVFSAREADLGGGAAKLLVREDQAEQKRQSPPGIGGTPGQQAAEDAADAQDAAVEQNEQGRGPSDQNAAGQ